MMDPRRFAVLLVIVGLGVTVWTGLAVNARATHGARTSGDEPHYLLTAVSLAQDRDITTGDEMAERAYTPFHESTLSNQTTPLADGRLVEPHDPLLPAILALPVAVGGWIAGKVTLALLAGALAVTMIWIAVRRFAAPVGVAVVATLAFSLAMPLSAYATQVYPEMPAALCVALAIAVLIGPFDRRGVTVWLAMLACLPWLSVKYAPVAVTLAAIGFVVIWRRRSQRTFVVCAATLVGAGVVYLLAHHAMYGGWTVYAAGDHFAEGGQLSVMGYEANYPGRSIRLVGLLVDRNFGLVAWAPVYLIAVPALAAMVRARPRGWLVLVLPLLAGWLNATFIAQTMHGWWSPGRQVVVVLPAVVVVVAWFAARVRKTLWVVAALGVVGIVNWMWLAVEASTARRTLIVDFFQTANPLYSGWSALLPNGATESVTDVVGFVVWAAVLIALAFFGWRSVAPQARVRVRPSDLFVHSRKEHITCPSPEAASVL
jgi:hypothetical protein